MPVPRKGAHPGPCVYLYPAFSEVDCLQIYGSTEAVQLRLKNTLILVADPTHTKAEGDFIDGAVARLSSVELPQFLVGFQASSTT